MLAIAEICNHIVAISDRLHCSCLAWQRQASVWMLRGKAKQNATLGILASQMVIRPGYIKGCLVHLWRFIFGTKGLNMHSFKPASIDYGSLVLNVYVDASFASGGGRSRSGLAMYLVNPKNGTESLIQWASRRQTSMATSAPEAEVSAMAEGYATSIFLFDTLSELGLVSGSGPSALMSMKTDSAVALKQLGTQSVTVRTRTAAQKLNYLRELIYENPQVEPIYISGDSQRADGLTKILSGKSLSDSQESLNLLPSTPLITGVQEERVSTVQNDVHAHMLKDTQLEADAPRVWMNHPLLIPIRMRVEYRCDILLHRVTMTRLGLLG